MNFSDTSEVLMHETTARNAELGLLERYSISYFLAAALSTLYVAWWVVSMFERQKLPPGPARLPFIGSLLFHGYAAPDFVKLSKKYGEVFTIFIGNVPLVILGSKRLIKEALDTKGNDFSGRGNGWLTMKFTDKKGGFSGSDYNAKFRESRSRALAILHNLGFGRPAMENKIRKEMNVLVNCMVDNQNKAFDPFKVIMMSHFNIMYSLLVGDRLSYESEKAMTSTDSIETAYNINIGIIEIWSFMRFIPKLAKEVDHVMTKYDVTKRDLREHIHQHIKTHTPGMTSDFIHAYLEKHIDPNAESYEADFENLHQLLLDILLNGTELPTKSIQWILILMANNPEIQRKAREEIDRVIGKDRQICMDDKEQLNYIQALIWETQRYKPLLPHGLPHFAERENTLGGYNIPQGTQLLAITPCVYWDAKIWGDPTVFRPERFIDDSGNFASNPEFLPFSLGKRPCFGEALARQMLFLYTATLLQKFEVLPPDGLDKVSEEGHFGASLVPKPTKFKFVVR